MSEFKISRIRYTWRGDWQSSFNYKRDDVVRYNGGSWVCIRQHTSSAFKTDQEFLANQDDTEFSPAWIRMTYGTVFKGSWNPSTLYSVSDVVSYGGYLYLATAEHTSTSDFAADGDNWSIYLETISWNSDWETATAYGIGDLVKYGGRIYRCIINHTSAATENDGLESDITDWEIYADGVDFKGAWAVDTRYKLNDLVEHNGYLWRCKKAHTPIDDSTINFDSLEFWNIELPGFEYDGVWSSQSTYSQGDVVRHGGYLYESLTDNYNVSPYAEFNNPDWRLLSKGVNFRGLWSANETYRTGDVVKRGGNLFVALSDVVEDGSSLDYLDAGDWEIIVTGQNWRGNWTAGTVYNINDIVQFQGSTYIATLSHTSEETPVPNFPGDNGEGIDYWDLLIEAPTPAGMNSRGDLLTFDLSRRFANDGSTFGPTNVPVGNSGELLTIDQEDSLLYKNYSVVNRVFYVDINGVDTTVDSTRGSSPFKPWRTIKFAAEQADDGFEGFTTIRVNTGEFEETLPISIPARTVILGSELRSTTIKPKPANPALANDYTYFSDALERISLLIQTIVSGEELNPEKTPSNALDQVVVTDVPLEDVREFNVTVATGDLYNTTGTGNIFYLNGEPNPTLQLVQGATYRFIQSDPSNIGHPLAFSPDITADTQYSSGITVTGTVGVNRVIIFTVPESGEILDEAVPDTLYYYCETHGTEMGGQVDIVEEYQVVPIETDEQAAFDIQSLVDDAQNYIDFELGDGEVEPSITGTNDAVTDTGYTNAVRAIQANTEFLKSEIVAYIADEYPDYTFDADFYRNQTERFINAFVYDIIYTGNYKTLLEARFYRNEVNGSITEDMFYCRDTTGVRDCTLKGITGGLNPPGVFDLYQRPLAGAYVSLDPGWGADDERVWITNRSPYIQGVTTVGTGCVGQKIDGALHNGGNKSITSNDFTQVLSDGLEATVNTRNQEAEVASVFSGDFTDELLIVEWRNAGQNYTQAEGELTGSGINGEILFEEFRDNAIFQSRLLDSNDNRNIDSIGGGGYTLNQNNAQISSNNDAASIVISANDTNTQSDYLGKRLIITSGVGTGQYGYITGYNIVSKEITVARESDNQPGWDHLVPGTPSVKFDSSTSYRIEPRVIFDEPVFSAESVNTGINTSWSAIVYGETSASYTDVASDAGTGDVITDDGLAPVTATFDIERANRTYSVELNNPGIGYAVGDILTIEGTDLDGASPLNDLFITVTGVTDDSSNSITSFTSEGRGASGLWVITSEAGTAGVASPDGTNWTSFNMPITGDWTNLAAGNGMFVAIQSDDGINNASNIAAYSYDGVNWTQSTMPGQRQWSSVVFGNGIFVAVAEDSDIAAFSTNGINWTSTTIPDFGDSTTNNWVDITYGKNQFVALANSNNISASGIYDSAAGTITWTTNLIDAIDDSSQVDWKSIAWGNNRFVAVSSQGFLAYSFDAINWQGGEMPTQDGSTAHFWEKIRYGNGQFFAIGETGDRIIGGDPSSGISNYAVTSQDGIVWSDRQLSVVAEYKDLAFGNPYVELEDSSVGLNTPFWIVPGYNTSNINKVRTGARALGTVTVSSGLIGELKLWDPGSGYIEPPSVTVVDPNATSEVLVENRIADGVLTNPTWLNRGFGYNTRTTDLLISGDGFADIIPTGNFVTVTGFTRYPEIGSQITFTGLDILFTIVTITELGELAPGEGLSTRLRITPILRSQDKIEHGTAVSVRERVAQCRITGHDFLDVGTGNFEETNYPDLYLDYDFVAAPENEVREEEGGKVFYTSTDQSGNFRTGELFAVEQATGIVTISSDFFNLDGLSELRLGGIRVGGSGTVIREFSTDPTLQADSNNIVPTQRAIAAFLANRLSLGGTSVEVNSLVAGAVSVGPEQIGHAGGQDNPVLLRNNVDFSGENTGISGAILAQTMFHASFNINNS